MIWEQEDESSYIPPEPPAPPEPHVLDQVVPEIREIFNNILKYRVDPAGLYYGVTLDVLYEQLKTIANNNIRGLSDSKDPDEFRYERKGYMYDPILQNFIQGSGGQISSWSREEFTMTPVVLRGITKRKQMADCQAAGRDFYYLDTGYFGNGKKKTFHRVTKNDVQQFGPIIERPGDRLAVTGVRPRKMRSGTNILLAPPSQKLLNLYDINLEEWLQHTQDELKKYTDRPVIIRTKGSRAARVNTDTMEMALEKDVYCLITFSSIAAGEALLHGKPAITLGPNAAAPLCSQSLSEIENLKVPTLDEVWAWAQHLAYCQFTEVEMRNGTAWKILNNA